MVETPDKLRLDKWLWHARFFKTRSLSAKVVGAGSVRVNGRPVSKASTAVTPGDVVTFPQQRDVRVIRIVELGSRRGPAPEAQTLYVDLAPPEPRDKTKDDMLKPEAGGRPTKRDRRALEQLRRDALE